MDATQSPPPAVPPNEKWQFYLAGISVLLPGLLGLTGNDTLAPIGAFLVAPLGSLVSGIVLGLRLGSNGGAKAALSVLFIGLCFVASEAIAAAGCSLGSFRMNFH